MSTQNMIDEFRGMSLEAEHGSRPASCRALGDISEEATRTTASFAKMPTPGHSGSGTIQTRAGQSVGGSWTKGSGSPGSGGRRCSNDNSDLESTSAESTPKNLSPVRYSSGESWAMAQDFLSSGSGQQRFHHRRSRSYRSRHHRDRKQYLEVDEWDVGESRPRVASMPCKGVCRGYDVNEAWRIRSFSITSKGFLDKGDCFINRSVTSSGELSEEDGIQPHRKRTTSKSRNVYKVLTLGSSGVGKKSLIAKLVDERTETSSSLGVVKPVSILLDGEEATLEFIDLSDKKVDKQVTSLRVDGYIVVYSIDDRRSFESAINRLYEIREVDGRHVALILVANKTDLVRSRTIKEEEGKAAANTYYAKYIEVSAAIDHKIDELLVGVLKQIRLIKKKYHNSKNAGKSAKDSGTSVNNCCLLKARENVLKKLFKSEAPSTKSCDNLYVL